LQSFEDSGDIIARVWVDLNVGNIDRAKVKLGGGTTRIAEVLEVDWNSAENSLFLAM